MLFNVAGLLRASVGATRNYEVEPVTVLDDGDRFEAVHGPVRMMRTDRGVLVEARFKATGTDIWKNSALKYRWLSGPSVQGNYVVVGDREGYVHWLQTGDGALAARERLSHKAIRAQPLVVDGIVYVVDVKGDIAAYRLAGH